MKKILTFLIISILTINIFGQNIFEFVNHEDGYSYIQINKNVESFTFKSDFKSIGNSGKVGFVIYTSDLSQDQLKDYLKAHADNAQFSKHENNGIVNLGSLSAGDRVGFYLERNNGDVIYETMFTEKHGTDYLEFSKNGVGSSKDEWMSIGNIQTKESVPSESPSGAPLPGTLAVLIVGVVGAGAYKAGKKK